MVQIYPALSRFSTRESLSKVVPQCQLVQLKLSIVIYQFSFARSQSDLRGTKIETGLQNTERFPIIDSFTITVSRRIAVAIIDDQPRLQPDLLFTPCRSLHVRIPSVRIAPCIHDSPPANSAFAIREVAADQWSRRWESFGGSHSRRAESPGPCASSHRFACRRFEDRRINISCHL